MTTEAGQIPAQGGTRMSVIKAVLSTVILGLLVAMFPFAPVVLMPLLALPLAHLAVRRGPLLGSLVAALAAVLVWLGGGLGTAMLVFVMTLFLGLVIGHGIASKWGFPRSLAAVAASAVAGFAVWGAGLWLFLGLTPTRIKDSLYEFVDSASASYLDMGVSADTVNSFSSQARRLIDVAPYVTPGLLVMVSILLAALALGLAYLLFPRVREAVSVKLSLSAFRLPWPVAYASILGLAMVLFARGDGPTQRVLLYSGINVLLVSQTLFFLQGLAVLHWFAVSRRLAGGSRVMLYAAGVLGQVFFQLTGLLGLFDTWLDYRKRFAVRGSGKGPVR